MSAQDPRPIVTAMYAAWFARDIPGVLDVCDEIVRVSQHYSDPTLPFTGTTVGKAAFADRLTMIFGAWRFERADPVFTYYDTVNARTLLSVSLRHLSSGRVFEGSFRHIFVVRNGCITQLEEYVDLEGLRAFLRLIR